MPRYRSQDWIMSPSRIGDGNLTVTDSYRCLSLDKEPKDLRCIAALESSEFVRQHSVKGIRNHGHDDIKVDFSRHPQCQGSCRMN